MRITLHTVGGLDEILPFAGLAHALQDRGHSVLLCIPEKFRERIMKRNLRLVSCGATFEEFLQAQPGTQEIDFIRKLTAEVPVHFVSLRDALREADLLIGGLLPLAGPSMAEQLSLPYLQLITSPVFLHRSEFPAPGTAARTGLLAGIERRRQARRWNDQLTAAINRERAFSGSSPITDLYSYLFQSGFQLIAVAPEFLSQAEMRNGEVTGFYFTEEEIPMEPEWQNFFASGTPVAFVGRVSIGEGLERALTSSGFRVLFSSEWKDVTNADRRIYPAENQIPTGAAVAIHNGTTGMITAAIRNGIPQVIAPELVVQADWARRVEQLNVGVSCSQDPTAIAQAAKRINADAGYLARARALSEKIRSRNAYSAGIDAIEKYALQQT